MLPTYYAQASPASAAPPALTKLFQHITQTQPHTFFCHLPISPQGKVNFQSCGYCPIEPVSVIALRIVPNAILAKNLPCYQHKLCSKPNRYFYQGISCCQKIDILYQRMAQDLHNWVPEIRHIKQLWGTHIPSVLPNIPASLSCHELTLDKKKYLIHVPEAQRGAVARIYLYMADTYQLKLEQELRNTLESWHELYAITAWEKTRNRLIYQAQGTYNHRIERL